MSTESIETAVTILGKTYYIKCPAQELPALKQATNYLENKLQTLLEANHVIGQERITIIAALNIAHELLLLRQEKNYTCERSTKKLSALKNKVDEALARYEQIEFPTTEQN